VGFRAAKVRIFTVKAGFLGEVVVDGICLLLGSVVGKSMVNGKFGPIVAFKDQS